MKISPQNWWIKLAEDIEFLDGKGWRDYPDIHPSLFQFLDPDSFPKELKEGHWRWTRSSARVMPPHWLKRPTIAQFLYVKLFREDVERVIRECSYPPCVNPFHMRVVQRRGQEPAGSPSAPSPIEVPPTSGARKPSAGSYSSQPEFTEQDLIELVDVLDEKILINRARSLVDLLRLTHGIYTEEQINEAIKYLTPMVLNEFNSR